MKTHLPEVTRFVSSGGLCVYRIPLEAFPGFIAYAHLVLGEGLATLVDVGSGVGNSNDHLLDGFARLRETFGETITLRDVKQILITHGHIDHFGGLTFVREHCRAPIYVHELDLRVLSNYEERVIVASRALRHFLREAGVSEQTQPKIMSMYLLNKELFRSVEVAFTYEALGMRDGPFEFTHVPGHCPGQVVVRFDDVLLTADHVLSKTTPHQAPETLTRYTGLGHYLESLERVKSIEGVRVALGGHEEPIDDLPVRVEAIAQMHRERLEKILNLLVEPLTISQVSHALFGERGGYNVLLALEETGAHVEYLAQRGLISIANLEEVGADDAEKVALRYRRVR
jgi:glyoxylase-like metal-dependent hydrolase (beta-lactamase superfamily II)